MGNELRNFGAGLLGGYRDVLGMKMKEDAQAKRDEALANRQANLEKLRFEREKPYKDAEQEQRWTQIGETKDQNQRMYDLQVKQENRQAAAQAASASNQARSLNIQEQQAKAANDFRTAEANGDHALAKQKKADAYNLEQVSSYGTKEYNRILKATGDETQAIAAQASIEALGVKNAKEKSEILSNKDYYSTINNITEKVVVEESNRLKTMEKDAIIEEATKARWTPSMGISPSAYLIKSSVFEAVSAVPNSQATSTSTTKKVETSAPQTVNPTVFNQLVKDRATLSPDSPNFQEAKSVYDKLTPQDKARVDEEAAQYSPGIVSRTMSSIREQNRKSIEQTRAEQSQYLPKW